MTYIYIFFLLHGQIHASYIVNPYCKKVRAFIFKINSVFQFFLLLKNDTETFW